MTKISKEDVVKTGSLAKLNLTSSEVDKFNSQLAGVLENFSSIDQVETKGVEVSAQVTGLEDVMVKDSLDRRISLDRVELLKNAPVSQDGYLVVPKIL